MRSLLWLRLFVLAYAFALARPLGAEPIPLTFAPGPIGESAFNSVVRSFIGDVRDSPDLQGLIELETVVQVPFAGELLAAVHAGAIDLSVVTIGQIEELGPQPVALFKQPAIFANLEELSIVENSWLGDAALSELVSADLVGLAFWNAGMTQFASDETLEDLDDLSGRKVLTGFGDKKEVIQGVGASPVVMAFDDLKQGLSTGIGDIAELSIESARELAGDFTHITEANYRPLVGVLVANREKWHSLPDQAQLLLTELARAGGAAFHHRGNRSDGRRPRGAS